MFKELEAPKGENSHKPKWISLSDRMTEQRTPANKVHERTVHNTEFT